MSLLLFFAANTGLFAQTEFKDPGGINNTGGINDSTIKSGNYLKEWHSSWSAPLGQKTPRYSIIILIIFLIIILLAAIYAVFKGIESTLLEKARLKEKLMNADRKKINMSAIQRNKKGIRFKLVSFIVIVLLLVISLISTPLYIVMDNVEHQTLLTSLWDRCGILMKGLASNVKAYLPARNEIELSILVEQMEAIPEAKYITITGFRNINFEFKEIVLASNDPNINAKINTDELQPGISLFTDLISPSLDELRRNLNNQAIVRVSRLSQNIHELSKIRSRESQDEIQSFETRIAKTLAEITGGHHSKPEFNFYNISSEDPLYLFYMPVMYRQGISNNYFHGLIRMEVSVGLIAENIKQYESVLFDTISIISLITLGIGLLGAFIFSSLMLMPIRRLMHYVEIIRSTENKGDLAGMEIQINTRDEISVLGDTINEMMQNLIKAEVAASELSIGIELQKKLLPLEVGLDGNKLNFSYKKYKNVTFFGYYEGARGISGDYFDYQDLGGRYYAIIKCDVSGHGVPAALLTMQVATMFLNYFKQWDPDRIGTNIAEIVYQINSFMETLAFKGRFAAFTLCIFDSQYGDLHFCNAGDNIIRIFDSAEGRLKKITLPQTPAAGVLPNSIIESTGGYQVQTLTLGHGDILLLYTDGIEEARRLFRDASLNEIICSEGVNGEIHGNHIAGQSNEEMGSDRIQQIVNAVMNRKTFILRKWHNPEGDQLLQFDFSTCSGGVDELIMAMIAVEKIFRCYRDPGASKNDMVLVDKKIDAFLKEHFLQYKIFCGNTRECPQNRAYMYYTYLKEDELYDDLTFLGIKRL